MFGFLNDGKVNTDESKIDELLSRSLAAVYPSTEFLREQLKSGKQLTIYYGIDPTAPTLHLGHTIPLRILRRFQDLGHKVIMLIGDFTGMIGDPTDKTAARVRLSRDAVLKNAARYEKQAGRFLRFEGKNPAVLKYNSVWLGAMSFQDVIEVATHLTVDQLLKRDMFARRMDEGKPIYLHEFLYPLMQGYDSVALDVDGEIGGNDQTFNMLAGRTLLKQIKNKEKFVLSTKLLTDESGKKMGKSEGNMVALTDSPSDVFGKIMSWPDTMIVPALELLTDLPLPEIASIEESIKNGGNPKDAKVGLAKEVVTAFFGAEEAEEAASNFGGTPSDILEVRVVSGTTLGDAVMESGLVSSKSELRRLIAGGAISIAQTGATYSTFEASLTKSETIKIGKHRFLRIVVSN